MTINGSVVTWDDISREQLKYLLVNEKMTEASIAELFGVTVSKVRYKKKKLKLSRADVMYEMFVSDNGELFDMLNQSAREWLLNPGNVDTMSKVITHYVFRNGPIECVHHSKKPVSQKDMKDINVYMVNHIAGLLTYVIEGNWLKLLLLFEYYQDLGKSWDAAVPETKKIDKTSSIQFKKNIGLRPELRDFVEA